jgi:NADH-quinone oxidoreductase subunit H
VGALLVWPGLAGGAALAWLYLWLARKLAARLQGRTGPPFYQPCFDFGKLLGKQALLPAGVHRGAFLGLPVTAAAAAAAALALLPAPGSPMRPLPGDLILLVYLLEVPALCEVLAGYASRSPYAQVSAARAAVIGLGFNLPFLAALMAFAVRAGSFQIRDAVALPLGPVHAAAAVAFLLAVPARLKTNPFSIPNAEQEIVAGMLTEYSGWALALFELAHGLELVALVGLLAALLLPAGHSTLAALGYLALGALLVGLVTVAGAATARLTLQQAVRFYWTWGGLAGLVAIGAALL